MPNEMLITFTGTIEQIIDLAKRLKPNIQPVDNKATKQSNNQPLPRLRYNNAWRMVLGCRHSIKQISEATGVSKATISNMRKAMVELSTNGKAFPKKWK